jgi:hypothetical protein
MSTPPGDLLRCPTCGAEQEWSDSCRRCRCDLRLLRAAFDAWSMHRRECLVALENGWVDSAARHARRSHELRPGAGSYRLLALCSLMSERWLDALEEARCAEEEP